MTDEELKAFMEANKVDIQQAIKANVIENILGRYRWSISDEITTVVNAFIKEHIAPEIADYLISEKGAILAAGKKAADEIGTLLVQTMVKRAAKNVEGYAYRKVIEGIFE